MLRVCHTGRGRIVAPRLSTANRHEAQVMLRPTLTHPLAQARSRLFASRFGQPVRIVLRDWRGRFARSCVLAWLLIGATTTAGCGEERQSPEEPTWRDVEPILRGQCSHCHGATASTTGAGFRFDFYEMTKETCGEAASALGVDAPMARSLAPQIARAITSDYPSVRPSMPPLPAEYLDEWEWQTILRWAASPTRGVRSAANTPPNIVVNVLSPRADKFMDVAVSLEDRDGDPVVGVLLIGDQQFRMDRGGSFNTRADTSAWEPGDRKVGVVLCDGLSSVSYMLGTVNVTHLQ